MINNDLGWFILGVLSGVGIGIALMAAFGASF